MRVVVNDANILIDLVELDLLPAFFALGFEMTTSSVVFDELLERQQSKFTAFIAEGKFIINAVLSEDWEEMAQIQANNSGLSEQDCSALLLAIRRSAILLTGDKLLRHAADSRKLEVHGHLWVFDQLVAQAILAPKEAAIKLRLLCDTINPRLGLPVGEVEKRVGIWERGDIIVR